MKERYNYHIEKIRFHLKKNNVLIITGWFPENSFQNQKIEVYLDSEKIQNATTIKTGPQIWQKYLHYNGAVSQEVECVVALPEEWQQKRYIEIVTIYEDMTWPVMKIKTSVLKKRQKGLDYHIEQECITEGQLQISGWAVGKEQVRLGVYTGGKKLDAAQIRYSFRRDVIDNYEELPKDYKAGFVAEVPIPVSSCIELFFESAENKVVYKTSVKAVQRNNNRYFNILRKSIRYFKKEGLGSTVNKIAKKVLHRTEEIDYDQWQEKHQPTEEVLLQQRAGQFSYEPRFSFVTWGNQKNGKYISKLIESIKAQTYRNWEICSLDGDREIEDINAAIQRARGEYIIFAGSDAIMAPDALYECVKALNQDDTIDVIYSDEDKLDINGKKYLEPQFKSDYNIDLLCSMNYIGHFCVVKREVIDRSGVLRKEFAGAVEYDFILRCCEVAQNIYHISKVLYHQLWDRNATVGNSVEGNSIQEFSEKECCALEAGRRAVEEHYKRIGIPAVVEQGSFKESYRTIYQWAEQPLVSIVIPNKDHIEDLRKCMDSIEERSSYRNYEFIIVENNSTKEETFAFYKEAEQRENVTVLSYEGGFNFSRINNFGVAHAKGEYILLLNNDTEIIDPNCIMELLGYCMREDVGVVGAKLCYEDDTIQHAGVVIGFGGMAGHTFIGKQRNDSGYMGRIACVQDYSAVTAACLMTKKSVYEAVGGLSEEFEVAFNDIDYCLKVRELGKLVVYNPQAELYHYESKSRGFEDTPEKIERFNSEVARFVEKWYQLLQQGDPYYNPNLALNKSDFSLKV